MSNSKTYLITSALPYVNGVKHIGNVAGSLLPADVFARYQRLNGSKVVFVCGTDDHGTTTEIAALKEGISSKEYSDKYHEIQREIYSKWNLSFDIFSRTSSIENHHTTCEMFQLMYSNGLISQSSLKIPYCLVDQRFIADRYIEGTCPNCSFDGARGDQCEKCGKLLDPIDLIKPRCNICKKDKIEFRESKHLFLDLFKLSDKLKEWLTKQTDWPVNARNFALQWIEGGLKPRCITRDLDWGVKVPLAGFENKVFYVWFDAPIGYISFTKQWALKDSNNRNWQEFWKNDQAQIIHFIGKDNIAFHSVIWPAMIMASGYCNLPTRVQAYEFLNLEGKKFSTSRNWGIDAKEALDWFDADYWRYYLISILPERSDANFSWKEFQSAANSDLADVYGNLIHRCLTFTHSKFGGLVPKPTEQSQWTENQIKFYEQFQITCKNVKELMNNYKLQEALRVIMDFARQANKFFSDSAPWKLECDSNIANDASTTIFLTVNACRSIALLLYPFVPSSSIKAFKYLNGQNIELCSIDESASLMVESGTKIAEKEVLTPLFTKILDEKIEMYSTLVSSRSKSI